MVCLYCFRAISHAHTFRDLGTTDLLISSLSSCVYFYIYLYFIFLLQFCSRANRDDVVNHIGIWCWFSCVSLFFPTQNTSHNWIQSIIPSNWSASSILILIETLIIEGEKFDDNIKERWNQSIRSRLKFFHIFVLFFYFKIETIIWIVGRIGIERTVSIVIVVVIRSSVLISQSIEF